MSTHLISEEDLIQLKANLNVVSATSRKVEFTPEFQQKMYDGLIAGKSISAILRDNGIDSKALGDSRLNGIRQRLYQKAEREEGFSRKQRENNGQAKRTEEQNLKKRVESLEHELAYACQEVEFLKKLRMADMEAQRQWELKHGRK